MADFSSTTQLISNSQNVQNVLRILKNIYATINVAIDLVERKETDSIYKVEFDHVFTEDQTTELEAMIVEAKTLRDSWADKVYIPNVSSTGTLIVGTGGGVVDKTFIVGTQTFTFKTALSEPRLTGEVLVSSTELQQSLNIKDALEIDIADVISVSVYDINVNLTSIVPGTAGNLVPLSVESGSGLAVSGLVEGKLSGGIDENVGPLA